MQSGGGRGREEGRGGIDAGANGRREKEALNLLVSNCGRRQQQWEEQGGAS